MSVVKDLVIIIFSFTFPVKQKLLQIIIRIISIIPYFCCDCATYDAVAFAKLLQMHLLNQNLDMIWDFNIVLQPQSFL